MIQKIIHIGEMQPETVQSRTQKPVSADFMMTSSNGNIFRVTGHLCGEITGLRRIPRSKASDVELWCFLWCFLHLIKRLSKHSRGWWFETLSRPLWRHCNVLWIPNTHHWPYSGAQPLALHVSIVSNAPVLARSLSSHSGFYIKCTILALRRMEVSWHLQEIYRANNFYVDYLIVVKLYTNNRFVFKILIVIHRRSMLLQYCVFVACTNVLYSALGFMLRNGS